MGSWGKRVVATAIETGRSIAETVGIIKPVAPEITITGAERDWGRVSLAESNEAIIADLPNEEYVPDELFTESEIPWKRQYAYTVAIYGRDLATGRFARQEYDLTTNRQLTIAEVKDMASSRIGKAGVSAIIDIFDVAVVNAWERVEY